MNFVAAYFSSFFFSTSSKDSSSFESNSQRSVLIKDFVVRGKICPNGNEFSTWTLKIVEVVSCPLLCLSQNLVLKQMLLCHLLKQKNNSRYNIHLIHYTFNGNKSGE